MSEQASFSDQVALVTGGSRGIGRGIATGLARAGAEVIIGARTLEAAEDAASGITDRGGRARGVALDISDDVNPAIDGIQIDIVADITGLEAGDQAERGALAGAVRGHGPAGAGPHRSVAGGGSAGAASALVGSDPAIALSSLQPPRALSPNIVTSMVPNRKLRNNLEISSALSFRFRIQ